MKTQTASKNLKKEIIIGFLIGLFANISGIYLYLFFFSDHDLEETIVDAIENDIMGSLIALGAILNLFVFFIFLKKKQIYRARGVVLATVLAGITILILKFF